MKWIYRKISAGLAVVLCLFFFMTPAAAASDQLLYVTGKGGVMATPDIVNITLIIETKKMDAKAAQEENNKKLEKVIGSLVAVGIKKEGITTSAYSLSQEYKAVNYQSVFDGYLASCTLNVKLKDTAKAGEAIDTAVAAGATKVRRIQFDVEDPSPYYAQALIAAGKDAQSKAEALASAFGVKIKAVLLVEEQSTYYAPVSYTPTPNAPMEDVAMAAPTMPVETGDISITATVRVTYSIG